MRSEAAEWTIQSSDKQRLLDTALALTATLFFISWLPFSLLTLLFSLLPCLLLPFIWKPSPDAITLGVTQEGRWWLEAKGKRLSVEWLSGSIRRRRYLRLVWGFWPWQVVTIHPDCLSSEDDFRRLKFYLYGAI